MRHKDFLDTPILPDSFYVPFTYLRPKVRLHFIERMVRVFMGMRIVLYCSLGIVIALLALSVYEPLFKIANLIGEGL